MRFSGIFQTISFTVRKRFVNAFLPSPYTVSKPSKNAPKTAKKIRNACGKNPHPLPPSCGSQSPKNRFVRPFFGILQVLALKTPARWPFSHSLCVFTLLVHRINCRLLSVCAALYLSSAWPVVPLPAKKSRTMLLFSDEISKTLLISLIGLGLVNMPAFPKTDFKSRVPSCVSPTSVRYHIVLHTVPFCTSDKKVLILGTLFPFAPNHIRLSALSAK